MVPIFSKIFQHLHILKEKTLEKKKQKKKNKKNNFRLILEKQSWTRKINKNEGFSHLNALSCDVDKMYFPVIGEKYALFNIRPEGMEQIFFGFFFKFRISHKHKLLKEEKEIMLHRHNDVNNNKYIYKYRWTLSFRIQMGLLISGFGSRQHKERDNS